MCPPRGATHFRAPAVCFCVWRCSVSSLFCFGFSCVSFFLPFDVFQFFFFGFVRLRFFFVRLVCLVSSFCGLLAPCASFLFLDVFVVCWRSVLHFPSFVLSLFSGGVCCILFPILALSVCVLVPLCCHFLCRVSDVHALSVCRGVLVSCVSFFFHWDFVLLRLVLPQPL
jgi:hypothetical protein